MKTDAGSTRHVSRRALLKAATLVAALPFARRAEAQRGDTRANDTSRERLQRTAGDPRRRVLIRGGSILTMDPSVGDFARGDLLIEGRSIAQVGQDLSAASQGAIVIDAAESVVIPGFVDPHIHAWQGQLAGLIPNSNGVADDRAHNYFTVMHQTLGPQYRPEDIYIGNLLTALTCIDAGITCFATTRTIRDPRRMQTRRLPPSATPAYERCTQPAASGFPTSPGTGNGPRTCAEFRNSTSLPMTSWSPCECTAAGESTPQPSRWRVSSTCGSASTVGRRTRCCRSSTRASFW